MPRYILTFALLVAIPFFIACSKSQPTEQVPENTEKNEAYPAMEKQPQATVDDATRAACHAFETPWGEGDWLLWAKSNLDEAEKWLTEAPQRMPKVDLSILPTCTHLTSVFLGFSTISDLTPVAGLPNLKILDLRFSRNVVDLTPLKQAAKLEQILIWGTQVSNLSPLTALPNLRSIDAKMTPVADIAPLTDMPNLEWIDLLQTKISDIVPLTKVRALKEIRLCNTQISDLSPLYAEGARYTYIDLCNTPVTDFSAFSHFPNLKFAQLWGLQIGDLSVFSGLNQLETLDLSNAKVDSLAPLEKLPSLKKLILAGVPIDQAQLSALKAAKPDLEIVLGN